MDSRKDGARVISAQLLDPGRPRSPAQQPSPAPQQPDRSDTRGGGGGRAHPASRRGGGRRPLEWPRRAQQRGRRLRKFKAFAGRLLLPPRLHSWPAGESAPLPPAAATREKAAPCSPFTRPLPSSDDARQRRKSSFSGSGGVVTSRGSFSLQLPLLFDPPIRVPRRAAHPSDAPPQPAAAPRHPPPASSGSAAIEPRRALRPARSRAQQGLLPWELKDTRIASCHIGSDLHVTPATEFGSSRSVATYRVENMIGPDLRERQSYAPHKGRPCDLSFPRIQRGTRQRCCCGHPHE